MIRWHRRHIARRHAAEYYLLHSIHVIVSKCFDFTKMLGKLVQHEVEDLPVLKLACGDEKSAPYPSQNKKAQVREEVPKEAFHAGRNFK